MIFANAMATIMWFPGKRETEDFIMHDSRPVKTTYSIPEHQQMLSICDVAAYRLVKQNQFKSVKVGRTIRVIKASFDAWLDGAKPDETAKSHI